MAEKRIKDGEHGAGPSLVRNAVAFVVAGAVAAAIGGAAGYQTAPDRPASSQTDRKGLAETNDDQNHTAVAEMGSLDLPPVVTNLAAPSDVWVRVEGTLIFEGKSLPHGEALAGQIAGDILAFLRTETLQQIQGVAGLQHLRADLNDRVATRSEGRVREIIIKSLVVQ